jgi:hypothetical protein
MERNAGKLDYVCHLLAWLGGGLIALTPFVRGWSVVVGGVATPVQVWPGNLIVEFMVATALGLLGTTLGGFWWGGGGGRESRRGRVAAVVVWLWGLAGWLGYLVPWVHWVGLAGLLVAFAGSWWRTRRQRRAAGHARQFSPAMPWNGVLCGLILALCVASDLMVLGKLEGPRSAILALIAVRVLTEVVIVSFVWCWLQGYVRWSPVGTRWLVGVLLGMTMVLLAAEIGMSQLWGKGLTLFFGELAVGGKFDLLRVMEGGSFKVTPMLGLTAAGVLLLVVGIYQGTGWLSRRMGLRVRPATLLAVAVGTWLLLLLEQASELLWNDRGGHWLQRRALLVHLCPSFSEPGWATFAVAFRDAARPVGLGVTRRPDVHLFIVETLRGDAMRPEVMPFLSHWRDTECQPVGAAYAASNATHLSWFALLSGKPPVFWDRDRQAQRPAPLLEILHAAGYRNELRSASIFDYAEMDTTNFGHGELTDVMVNTRINPNSWSPGPSERDRQVFEMWRQSVLAQPPGGTFRLTAVESPHYPYHWAASFVPPCPDYYQSAMFPLRPSAREIQLVRNSYHNSVAWVDSLFRDYIGFLKTQGRYDDAMIVVTGDHGEELQERGFWFHASALTPEQTAVPVLVKWPKDLSRGEPVGQASHLDVVPSVMDALGCPAEQWQGLAGRSLRQGGDPTALVMTHFASQNGEGMHWRRNGYEAAFSWKKIWVPGMPERLWLERVTGPQGTMRFASPAAAEAALREHFPDAFERWFTRFERDQSSD